MAATFQYFPFDTGPGANSDETRWGEMMQWMRTTGILTTNATLDPSANDLAVTENGTLGVQTAIGKAWIQGFYFEQDGDYFAIGVNPNTNVDEYARIDLLVLQLDLIDDNIGYLVLEGTPAASPVAPSPEQDSDYWQMPLAQIYVEYGAEVIITSNITDERVMSLQGAEGSSAVTLTSAGGTQTLVDTGSGPALTVYGLTAGSNITLNETGGAITIATTGVGSQFLSTEQTGTGSPQTIAHGLGTTPAGVVVTPVDTTSMDVISGGWSTSYTTDATNVYVTATSGLGYVVSAWAS